MNPLEALLPSVRRELLALLYLHPEESFHLREIARRLHTGHGILQREIARLVAAGLLLGERRGHRLLYRVNPKSFLTSELTTLIEKTVGPTGRIREVLAPLADQIAVAFLYGSIPAGTHGPSSDVDLMIVGSVTFDQIAHVLPQAESLLHREINPTIFPIPEFQAKRSRGNVFLKTVLVGPKTFVIGDEHVLEELD